MRRKYGDREACARCGQDIEWTGKAGGWRDRGGNRACVPYHDRSGEVVTPPPEAKHKPEATMYARREPDGLLALRQERYRERLEAGVEHPHDVCALAASVEVLRYMTAPHWPDADFSRVEGEAAHG